MFSIPKSIYKKTGCFFPARRFAQILKLHLDLPRSYNAGKLWSKPWWFIGWCTYLKSIKKQICKCGHLRVSNSLCLNKKWVFVGVVIFQKVIQHVQDETYTLITPWQTKKTQEILDQNMHLNYVPPMVIRLHNWSMAPWNRLSWAIMRQLAYWRKMTGSVGKYTKVNGETI